MKRHNHRNRAGFQNRDHVNGRIPEKHMQQTAAGFGDFLE
jgi:hypothetical protein